MTDILTDHAVAFLKRSQRKPFLLYLAHKAVHSGFISAERHQNEFADETILRAPSARDTLEGKPVLTRKLPTERKDQDPGREDRAVFGQLRGILAIDEGVGRLLKTLEETKQLDSTLIIFTSDNGFFWGEHGLGDKRAAYEESIRIPLLMRYPKLIQPGSTRDQLAMNVDIAPTLLELAGVSLPKQMHGRSLLPVLKEDTGQWREAILTEYFANAHNRIPAWQAVRTPRWKYIHYTNVEGVDELYDLTTDRFEIKNRIQEPDVEATLSEMKTSLARLLEQTQ
jgi:N-acetylglucosamine-6-sulfatase